MAMITINSTVNASIEKVWDCWTTPHHIIKWNFANEDWHSPNAQNDLREGGKFNIRMEAKDGSFGFDFEGVYDMVSNFEKIEYQIADGRKVMITFQGDGSKTNVTQTFEAETEHSLELQQNGWQAILDNFKKYVESLNDN